METAISIAAATVLIALLCGAGVFASDGTSGELVKVIDDLEFPEGPAWDGKGSLVLSDCNRFTVVRLDADGKVEREWLKAEPGDEPFAMKKSNGLTFYKDGSLFLCDHGRNAVLKVTPDKKTEIYADNCDGKPFRGPNDLAFDPKGNLYFTDPVGSGKDNPIGCVYRVDAKTRKVTHVASGLAFPNGLAFSADAKTLFVCESQHNRVLSYKVAGDGALTDMKVAADLSIDGPGEPDGMAIDTKGRLWVTHFGAHTVLVFEPDGKLARTIKMPHDNSWGPTNIEFAGPDLKTVYITDPGSHALYRMKSDTAGLKLFCSPR